MTATPRDSFEESGTRPEIRIDSLGGNCPVQADGFIDGEPFYFRSRGQHWSIEIGPGNTHRVVEVMDKARCGLWSPEANTRAADAADVMRSQPCWRYEEPYGDAPYVAGLITDDEARAFIAKGAAMWRASKADKRRGDTSSDGSATP